MDGPDPLRVRALRALSAHAPGAGADVRPLGRGLDHGAFLAGDLVVRVVEAAGRSEVVREAALLRLVAGRVPLPVPEPVLVDPDEGVLGYRLLPGRPLLGRTPPAGAAEVLGRFLRELHAIEPAEVGVLAPVDPADPEEWLDELDGPEALLRVLRSSVPAASGQLVLAHADLGAEHLLALDGRLSGVIDWSDAAVTDPALDAARLLRDFGPAFLDDVLRAYGHDTADLRERITFFARCAAIEDLAYGSTPGYEEYARAAHRSLGWLFPGAQVR